jgi:hypothetical protein
MVGPYKGFRLMLSGPGARAGVRSAWVRCDLGWCWRGRVHGFTDDDLWGHAPRGGWQRDDEPLTSFSRWGRARKMDWMARQPTRIMHVRTSSTTCWKRYVQLSHVTEQKVLPAVVVGQEAHRPNRLKLSSESPHFLLSVSTLASCCQLVLSTSL